MPGALGRLDLRPPEDIERGKALLTTPPGAALEYLHSRGLDLAAPPRSGYKGEMPAVLTSLDDEMLGNLLNDLSAWCAFVESELARATTERDAATEHLDFVRARVRLGLKLDEDGKKLTVQDKNDRVETDPRVVEAASRELYIESVYTLTRVIRDRAQRDWDTVSRRITQRGQEVERFKREANVAGIPVTGSRSFVRRSTT